MKPRLPRFFVIILVLAIAAIPQMAQAGQTVKFFPDEIPNGIASGSGEQYHQRIDITFTTAPVSLSVMFTITLPPEVELVKGTYAVIPSNGSMYTAWSLGTKFGFFFHEYWNSIHFGFSGARGVPNPHWSGQTLTVEFDVVTPGNFTGMASGAKVDTVYKFDFAAQSNVTDFNVPVAKVQNRRVSAISFSSPDSILGDTTSAGGRFYKMDFPTGLPDLSHTNISGLSIARSVNGLPDTKTDVFYSFYLSQDSTLG